MFYDCALLPFYMNDVYFPCRQTVQVVTSRCCTGPFHYPSRYECSHCLTYLIALTCDFLWLNLWTYITLQAIEQRVRSKTHKLLWIFSFDRVWLWCEVSKCVSASSKGNWAETTSTLLRKTDLQSGEHLAVNEPAGRPVCMYKCVIYFVCESCSWVCICKCAWFC